MKNIYTRTAKPAKQTVTVGDQKQLRGKKQFE